jgi:hypothetical protein
MRAWLTGVGAMTLANALVFSVLFELWSRGMLQFPEGRPTFEVAGLPSYAFGAAVAVRAGGWRGLLPLVVLASLWMVMVPFIGPDRDFFVRQLWAYGGIALGVLLAAVRPVRLSSAAWLGAGVYGIATAANGVLPTVILQQPFCRAESRLLSEFSDVTRCLAVVQALTVLCSVIGGVAAGLIVARSISISGTILLALTLALPSALIVAHQGGIWQYDGVLSLVAMANGVLAGLALVLAGMIARWMRDGRAVTGPLLRPNAGPPA